MSAVLRRILFWGAPTTVLAAGLFYAFMEGPIEVDLTTIERGPLVVTVAEEGESRIRDIFTLSAPIRGRALRIEVDAGDFVVAGHDVLVEIEPMDPEFLDSRTAAEAAADIERAKATLALSLAELEQQKAEQSFAASELGRALRLAESRTVSERTVDDARRAQKTAAAAVGAATASVSARQSELAAAKARLLRPKAHVDGDDCACLTVRAPVSGRILRVLQKSAGVVQAGQPLVEIGDPANLEIVTEFLSTDAVGMEQGQRVIIERWGGPAPLRGLVERVEPYGFTKVSALGIEEQRVGVIIALTDPPAAWSRLGHGYQVEAQVVLWEHGNVVKVPLTALFRSGEDWAVFIVEDETLAERPVRIGQRSDTEAEVIEGLVEGDRIVLYPNDALAPGKTVVSRIDS